MPSFAALVNEQSLVHIPTFTLESGSVLRDVPVAFKTWGRLNKNRDNVMIICHAFTGSADVEDWWVGPLMGPGKAFDSTRFFIFCGNVMGSPYGSVSPLSINPDSERPYGPEFPATSIRDDVRLHKLVLDQLGVQSVAVAIGGSMGGMAVLEWPLCTPQGYVRHIVPIATSSRHSAWCISWGEAQRQSIYSDPLYLDGYYDVVSGQPKTGLAAARMAALLTYRSRDSFETRFGRKIQPPTSGASTPPLSSSGLADQALAAHNDGHKGGHRVPRYSASSPSSSAPPSPPSNSESLPGTPSLVQSVPTIFSAQNYLRYQGDKFTARFDANCYIHLSRKMDTHDISRGRVPESWAENETDDVGEVLATLPPRALVISIQTDGLFTPSEQRDIADHIPGARLVVIPSPDGHDGFLLEFEQINGHILAFLNDRLPEMYEGPAAMDIGPNDASFSVKKTSMFGEAEADIIRW
ncbi:hypothetical protein BS47DRAFT_1376521 [Hydnum rufescens UP504]|uniref:AB hydrolase-1 domain-containing protein n=1 Tax=Hydnum rufescens UP504 TaxID=1448309 RepID=A0A9P6B030_9AGAM|nr:hypothetical protein BS47DRAFT_1376521 [Hydnum rufescens UP504]